MHVLTLTFSPWPEPLPEKMEVTIPKRELAIMDPKARMKIQTDAFLYAARNRLDFTTESDEREQVVRLKFHRPEETEPAE